VRFVLPKPLTCPQCGERIWRGALSMSLNKRECPYCRAHVRIANSYELFIGAVAITSAALVGIATHTQSSDGTWLLGMIAAMIVSYVVLLVSTPPWLKLGSYQSKWTVAVSFLRITTYMSFFGLLALAGFSLHAASKEDLQENLEMLSVPLASISRNFLLSPESSLTDICGVVLGNSFLYGLVILACYKFVHRKFRRARVTQLSLSAKNPTDEDD
jgi:hypothetical protein